MKTREERVRWFREARFGMFVHWGIYSLLGRAEWVMHNEEIPKDEYRKLAAQFNPVKFDADAWAQVMQDAGMKYIVITAKHHDGFAMFKSQCSDYNIVDATPFDRDPIHELAEACAGRDIKLCFYYSHVQDWYEHRVGWDYPALGRAGKPWNVITEEEERRFNVYYERKCKPQIRELLTQYGPIGLLWFDTPIFFTDTQSKDLADLIRSIQPDCLINGRILNKQHYPKRPEYIDYEGMGDNEVPPLPTGIDWEAPMTSCNGWGYRKPEETNWKPPELLLGHLIRMSASGGNYLLNVGPSPEGELPEPAAERFRYIGRWLDTNGPSIYGTAGNPFGHDFEWGTATTSAGKVFLHVTDGNVTSITVNGLENKPMAIYLLSDPERRGLIYRMSFDKELQSNQLSIDLPSSMADRVDNVVVVETDGEVRIEQPTSQLSDGTISLPGPLATLHTYASDSSTQVKANGIIGSWFDPRDWAEWDFKVIQPGIYSINLVLRADFWGMHRWDVGHRIRISVGDTELEVEIGDEGEIEGEGAHLTRLVSCGRVELPSQGVFCLSIKPEKISTEHHWGLRLQSVELKPV